MTLPPTPQTETADSRYAGLDTWTDTAILTALLDSQKRSVDSVTEAIPEIARAAQLAAAALTGEGRLIYLAAGSPALISLADALEIPQTYGIPRERIELVFAGGRAITENLTGPDEDRAESARADVATTGVDAKDCVIAVSASGSTPYTVAGLTEAKARGAATIAIANNKGAPLFAPADVSILLSVGAEVISGSTRLGAGTAQKVVLNLISTLVGVRLGHVHDNHMVNLVADNAKLRARAERMVMAITGVSREQSAEALRLSEGHVKPAVLLCAGVASTQEARAILASTDGRLRDALILVGR
jgi:N-acetylmuramic acid 6-phosphate etherase